MSTPKIVSHPLGGSQANEGRTSVWVGPPAVLPIHAMSSRTYVLRRSFSRSPTCANEGAISRQKATTASYCEVIELRHRLWNCPVPVQHVGSSKFQDLASCSDYYLTYCSGMQAYLHVCTYLRAIRIHSFISHGRRGDVPYRRSSHAVRGSNHSLCAPSRAQN